MFTTWPKRNRHIEQQLIVYPRFVVDYDKMQEETPAQYAGLLGKAIAFTESRGQVRLELESYSLRDLREHGVQEGSSRSITIFSGEISPIDTQLDLCLLSQVRRAMQHLRSLHRAISVDGLRFHGSPGRYQLLLQKDRSLLRQYMQALEPNLLFPDTLSLLKGDCYEYR